MQIIKVNVFGHTEILNSLIPLSPESVVIVNDKLYTEWPNEIPDDATVVIVERPGVEWATVGAFLLKMVAAMAVSFVLSKILAPKTNKDLGLESETKNKKSSSVYGINNNQNAYRLGQSIPYTYGRVRMYPSLVAPPYRYYEDNNEFLNLVMDLGMSTGNSLEIEKIMLSNTDAAVISKTDFDWSIIDTNKISFYDNIQGLTGFRAFPSNYQLPDVSDLTLKSYPLGGLSTRLQFIGGTNEIRVFPNAAGVKPDLSEAAISSALIIVDSDNNNGQYVVESITVGTEYDSIFVETTSFVQEPAEAWEDLYKTNLIWGTTSLDFGAGPTGAYTSLMSLCTDDYCTPLIPNLKIGEYFKLRGDTANAAAVFRVRDIIDGTIYLDEAVAQESVNLWNSASGVTNTIELSKTTTLVTMEWERKYGPYMGPSKTPQGRSIEVVEVDINFPRGLYTLETDGSLSDRTVEMLATVESDNLPAVTITTTVTDGTMDPIRKTVILEGIDGAENPRVYLKRLTGEATDTNAQDLLIVPRVKFIYAEENWATYGEDRKPKTKLLVCKIKATNAISSLSSFQVNAWVKSTISEFNLVVKDIAALAGLEIDSQSYEGQTVNGTFDSKLTVMDALSSVCEAQGFIAYPQSNRIQVRKDEIVPYRSMLFNETNILKDTLVVSYNFYNEPEPKGFTVTYNSFWDWSIQNISINNSVLTDIEQDIKVNLFGVTDVETATGMLKLMDNRRKYRNKTVEFTTDIQGYVPQYLDRVGVTFNAMDWGAAGAVYTRVGDQIVVECDFDFTDVSELCQYLICTDNIDCAKPLCCDASINTDPTATFAYIIFKKQDGTPSSMLQITSVVDKNTLEITGLPEWVHGYETDTGYDNTTFSIGTKRDYVQDFIITEIAPKNEREITIKGVNYDERVYS